MAGYWLSSVFACSHSHLDRTSNKVNKGFIIWFSGNFFLRNAVVPNGQDSSILPARVDNPSAGFDSPCPLEELAI